MTRPGGGPGSLPTVPVTDAEAFRFVAGYYGRRAADVKVLGAGEWSRAYALVLDGREAVIRFGDHAGDFLKDQAMAAHSSAALPVPSVLEAGAAGGGYFAVSERAHGGMLDDLDGPGMRAALPGLLAALDALRDIDVPGTRGLRHLDAGGDRPGAGLGAGAAGHQPGNATGSGLAGRPGCLPGWHGSF